MLVGKGRFRVGQRQTYQWIASCIMSLSNDEEQS